MSALEIKPGKYRTRDGSIATVTNPADQYWVDHGYAWRAADANGAEFFVTADGRYRSKELYGDCKRTEWPLDLIERIEDEPKAEEKTVGIRKYEYVCGIDLASGSDQTGVAWPFPVASNVIWESGPRKLDDSERRYISDGAWRSIKSHRRFDDDDREACEKSQRIEGNYVLSEAEYDALAQAARVVDTANTYAKEACGIVGNAQAALDEATKRIARLEAENESLSRQLRSRALNSEPVTTGKPWRWSPMV